MKEIQYLGVRKTGYIDPRYQKESTTSFSIFECPICLKHYELKTSRGKKQETCKDCRGSQNITHGHSDKRYYQIWQGMKYRCNNSKSNKFHCYGGKGITVDPSWETFEGFWNDMGSTYQDGLTIDRIDSSLGYNKDNCRWISLSDNSSETCRKRSVTQYRQVYSPKKDWIKEAVWESALQAAESLGLVPAHISAVCTGKRKTHGGFKWQFTNQEGEV